MKEKSKLIQYFLYILEKLGRKHIQRVCVCELACGALFSLCVLESVIASLSFMQSVYSQHIKS